MGCFINFQAGLRPKLGIFLTVFPAAVRLPQEIGIEMECWGINWQLRRDWDKGGLESAG